MTISEKGLAIIKGHEAFRSKPYKDSVGKPTIGYGFTYYLDGKPVKLSDPEITQAQADMILRQLIATDFQRFVPTNVNQNQFDALVSLIYNIGVNNFNNSTLKKKVIANPNDPTIASEFAKWDKGRVNGVLTEIKGLTNRRKAEAELYFLEVDTPY